MLSIHLPILWQLSINSSRLSSSTCPPFAHHTSVLAAPAWLKSSLYKSKAVLSAPLTIKEPIDYSIDRLTPPHLTPNFPSFIWMASLRRRWVGDVYLPASDTSERSQAERHEEWKENKKAGEKGSRVFNFPYRTGEQRRGVLEDTLINRLPSGLRAPSQYGGSIRARTEVTGWTGAAGEQVTRHRLSNIFTFY